MPLLGELRSNVTRLGDPQVSAAVHIYIGEVEAKRGFFRRALWHTRLGQRMLLTEPNVWLEAVAENTHVAVAIMRSEAQAGLQHARRGLSLADQSGRASTRRAHLGNLGNLLYLLGDFSEAIQHLESAVALLPSTGEHCNANLDSL